MSSFHQNVPADAILCGSGEANAGMIVRVHCDQPIGAPSLCGDFTVLQANHDDLMERHLGDAISHNAFIGVRNTLPRIGETSSFEQVRSELVAAVGADRMEVVNENLLGRQAWEHIGGFGSMLTGGSVKGALKTFGMSMKRHASNYGSAMKNKSVKDINVNEGKLKNDWHDIQTMIKTLQALETVIKDTGVKITEV